MKRINAHSSRPQFIGKFRVPDWWDCQWRRTACGSDGCAFCNAVGTRRHLAVEGDTDPIHVLASVDNPIQDAMAYLAAEMDAEGWQEGAVNDADATQPPEPSQFGLYNELLEWYDDVMDIVHDAYSDEISWAQTDAAADVTWYASTLLAKAYRQLTTRWEFENAKDLATDIDYIYTRYVLGECLRIVRRALKELAFLPSPDQRSLRTAEILLAQFEMRVLSI